MNGRRTLTRISLLAVQAAALLLLVTAAVSAIPPYVENATDSILYLRSAGDDAYRQVPPGGLLPVVTSDALEGFAYDRGSFQLWTVELAAGQASGSDFLRIEDADLSRVRTIDPSEVAETLSLPRLDNRYLEWVPVTPLFARGRGRAPLASFVDGGSGRAPVNPADSMLWERAGTDLQWLKSVRAGDDLFLAASAYSAFSASSFLHLYIYGEDELPVASIEIDPSTGTELVLMWMPRRPEPVVVGNAVAGDYFLEAQIWLDVVVDEIETESGLGPVLRGMISAGSELGASEGGPEVMVEIATASSAAGAWEEFVLARLPFVRMLSP